MDDDQIAELEMHLAAGTDLATAFAAVQEPTKPIKPKNRFWFNVGLVIGLLIGLLWLLS